jgi:hypothetical protein
MQREFITSTLSARTVPRCDGTRMRQASHRHTQILIDNHFDIIDLI